MAPLAQVFCTQETSSAPPALIMQIWPAAHVIPWQLTLVHAPFSMFQIAPAQIATVRPAPAQCS